MAQRTFIDSWIDQINAAPDCNTLLALAAEYEGIIQDMIDESQAEMDELIAMVATSPTTLPQVIAFIMKQITQIKKQVERMAETINTYTTAMSRLEAAIENKAQQLLCR